MVTDVRIPKRETINEAAGIVDRPQSYSCWYGCRHLRHDWRGKYCIGFQRVTKVRTVLESTRQERKPYHGRKLALLPLPVGLLPFLPFLRCVT
jgi:hypothetical protein